MIWQVTWKTVGTQEKFCTLIPVKVVAFFSDEICTEDLNSKMIREKKTKNVEKAFSVMFEMYLVFGFIYFYFLKQPFLFPNMTCTLFSHTKEQYNLLPTRSSIPF